METVKTTPSISSSSLPVGGGGGQPGAGGKSRKAPARKPPAAPYDRPMAARQRRDGSWLSKLVDPTCRLIAGRATKMFPSFFSKFLSTAATLPPSDTTDRDKLETGLEVNACKEEKYSLNLGISRVTDEVGPCKIVEDGMRCNFECSDVEQDKIKDIHDDPEFNKI